MNTMIHPFENPVSRRRSVLAFSFCVYRLFPPRFRVAVVVVVLETDAHRERTCDGPY